MSRLAGRFTDLKAAGRTALVPYIAAGDPGKAATVPLMHALVKAGADALELGVPFSDPSADGPVIQAACERALAAGTTLKDVLAMVREFRATDRDTPVILMGYLNPVEAFGAEAFAAAAAEAGVDGVLTVDMPPEEAAPLAGLLKARGLDPIFLLAPTTDMARARRITETASGFVYYVSLKGVTGATRLDLDEVRARLGALRSLTPLPVGVGFGVRDAATAAALAEVADAVIVGSAVVSRVAEYRHDAAAMTAAVQEFVKGLRQAMDAARRTGA
ncbi:MAG TPA: tryptophan synthase subunit alpha [Gammaproteobacteria bacterium]|nr:tryptophan synthase subunit alpha [Gammaproteobacteria bacterium]